MKKQISLGTEVNHARGFEIVKLSLRLQANYCHWLFLTELVTPLIDRSIISLIVQNAGLESRSEAAPLLILRHAVQ